MGYDSETFEMAFQVKCPIKLFSNLRITMEGGPGFHAPLPPLRPPPQHPGRPPSNQRRRSTACPPGVTRQDSSRRPPFAPIRPPNCSPTELPGIPRQDLPGVFHAPLTLVLCPPTFPTCRSPRRNVQVAGAARVLRRQRQGARRFVFGRCRFPHSRLSECATSGEALQPQEPKAAGRSLCRHPGHGQSAPHWLLRPSRGRRPRLGNLGGDRA